MDENKANAEKIEEVSVAVEGLRTGKKFEMKNGKIY